jgi:aminoglycoside phosphotransferase (APT) family kinase protein
LHFDEWHTTHRDLGISTRNESELIVQNRISPTFLHPPVDEVQFQYNDWFPVQPTDATAAYLTANLWDLAGQPQAWQAARLSSAVYLFREQQTFRTWLVKYYGIKVGERPAAVEYAQRELESTRRAMQSLQANDGRVPEIYACSNGTLFMEYVQGLTLEDYIAVRRSRPGLLPEALQNTARLLAALHTHSEQKDRPPAFEWALNDTRKYTRELAEHGVLEGNHLVSDGVLRMLARWEADRSLAEFPAVYVHGDATTSNFVFSNHHLVAIDWERMHLADPALDLGRLMAEIGHSIMRQGGREAEAEALIEHLCAAYQQALPPQWDGGASLYRAQFYRAGSILRIARNGWIPRQERLALVAQAMALLSVC